MLGWAIFVPKRTLITSITPISKKIVWVSESFTLIKGNSVFAQNLLMYLRSKYWENVNFNCFTESYDECKSKNLGEDSIDSYEENVKNIRKLNINSLRNEFDLLAEQIKGILDVLVIPFVISMC